jgi:hypothetical protein
MRILIATALLFAATASAQARAPVDAREARQDARISAGIAHGQLTRCEAARLTAREARIEASEARYRASGGLQPAERRNLERRLDRASRDIHEQRHDGNGCW